MIINRTRMFCIAFSAMIFIFGGATTVFAATGDFDSRAAGNWNAPATWGKRMTGTVTFVNNNMAVVGVGTSFTTELTNGDILMTQSNGTIRGTVASITDNTHLTLVAGSSGGSANAAYAKEAVPTSADGVITITDNITVTANVTVDQVVSTGTRTLTINNGVTLTVADGTGTDFSTGNMTVTVNGTLTVNGSFIGPTAVNINSGGIVNVVGTLNPTNNTPTVTVNSGGNLNLTGSGSMTIASVSTLNVSGTITMSGSSFISLSRGNGGALGTIDSGGLISMSGTTNIKGAVGSNTNGVVLTVANGGNLVMGESATISGPGKFTLSSGGSISIGSTAGIASSGATGNIQVTDTRTYNTAANYTYNGTVAQVTGNGLLATVTGVTTIDNTSGVTLTNDLTATALTLTNGTLNGITNSKTTAIAIGGTVNRTNGFVNGNLAKNVATGATSRTFEIGTTNYNPVTVAFGSVTVAGTLTVKPTTGDHPTIGTSTIDPALSVNKYWTLTNSGITFNNYSATFNFVSGDKDASADTTNFIVGRYNAGWTYPTVGTKTSISTQATGLTLFGDFQLGNTTPVATKFVIIQPTDGTVGTPSVITVQAEKADDSIDTNYQGDVTLNTTGSATGGGLVDIVNGVGTLNISDTHAETVMLSLTDSQNTNLNVSSTQSLVFVAGPVASFALSDPGNMYARTRLGYTVSRYDAFGNAVGSATPTTVYLYTSSTGGTQKFYNDSLAGSVITSITIDAGHSTANFWYYDETPGTYTVTASDNSSGPNGATGIADATDSVIVIPVATKFVILPPTSGTVDAPIVITVQAQKPDNSIDTNYQSDVTLNTTGSATGGGLVDIVNGVGTLNISDTLTETVDLSLTDSESTNLDVSSTQSAVFAGGAISQFVLNHPATLEAGQRAAYTITREDQYGNISSLGANTVYLYSSSDSSNKKFYDAATSGNVISSIAITDGQSTADVWYYDELPGSWTVTASDSSSAPNGNTGINDAVDSLAVTAGPVTKFVLNDPGDMTVDTVLGYTVTRKDQFNNLVTSGATTAYMYSNSNGTSTPAFYDTASAVNPVTSMAIQDGNSSVNVWYLDPNPGTWTVSASDNATTPDGSSGIIDATDTVVVSAAPIVATRFVILPPTNGTVDASITITVQAEDGSGNIDSTYQNDVTIHSNGAATGAGLVNIVNGVGTISLSDTVAQVVNLSLTDSQATGLDVSSTQVVTFAPGAVAQFALDNPGDVAAGTRIGYTVTRKDQYGNVVTAGATTAYLYSTSDGVNKKFFDAASGGSSIASIVIPDAQSTAGFWEYDEKAGNWFITVSDSATAPDSDGVADASDGIAVQSAATAKFLLNDPENMTVNTRLGYTVTRKDQFDNLVTTGVALAYLYSSSTGTTTAFYSSAVGGAPTTFATINDGSSSSTFWYYDQTAGTWLVTASDSSSAPNGTSGIQDAADSVTVSSIPIVATRLVILPVASVQIGTPASVTIEARDDNGNIDTTIQSGVTLVSTGSVTGAGLVTLVNGVGTKSLQDTAAETVTLSLSDTQNTNLDVSSTQDLTFSATPVAPAAAGTPGGAVTAAPIVVGVRLSGLAFPRAKVQVLAVSSQGSSLKGQATATASGTFSLLLKGVEVGVGSYGIVGTDEVGRTTQTKVFNANYDSSNPLLTLTTTLSPTLGLVHPMVRKGDMVGFLGKAAPRYSVEAQVDGKSLLASAAAGSDGSYKLLLQTGNLDLGSHTVRVRQVSPTGEASDYSPQKIFFVTNLFTPQTDFNQDGSINVQDWSIFLSRWNSPDKATQMLDDLNGDGKIDVSDLSIFVRTLKK